MMHPKMLRRILAVASDKLTQHDRYGFFLYFELLKKQNEKTPRDQRRTMEELLLAVLSAYLPGRWRHIARRRSQDSGW
jgi:hypothetical protein